MFDRDEDRYHGYPTIGDIVKAVAWGIITLPYYAVKDGIKKLTKKDGKKKG